MEKKKDILMRGKSEIRYYGGLSIHWCEWITPQKGGTQLYFRWLNTLMLMYRSSVILVKVLPNFDVGEIGLLLGLLFLEFYSI